MYGQFIGNKSKNKYTFLIKDSISVQIKDENDNEFIAYFKSCN